MAVGVLNLHIYLPGCTSLKEKRSRIRPLLARLHREFNISAAELDHLDSWQSALIACAVISNDATFTRNSLIAVARWVEKNWSDLELVDHTIDLL